ncbi:hypothetical protein cypCar_00045877, partial [Cyprinus carpio]
VSGVDTDEESVSVMERDTVTLHTGVKTNQQEKVKWFFNNTCIARITGDLSFICTDVQCNEEILQQLLVCVSDVPAAQRDEKTKSVVEGQSVTLDPGVTKNPNDVMTWYFNDALIAEITGDQKRFRDRLKLNNQTGSLTITNTRTTDSGDYKLLISSSSSVVVVTSLKSFNISITAVPGLSPGAVGGICGVLLPVVCVVGGLAKRKGICMQPNNQENYVLQIKNTTNDEAAKDTSLST